MIQGDAEETTAPLSGSLLLKPLLHLVDLVVLQVFQLAHLPLLDDQFQVKPDCPVLEGAGGPKR